MTIDWDEGVRRILRPKGVNGKRYNIRITGPVERADNTFYKEVEVMPVGEKVPPYEGYYEFIESPNYFNGNFMTNEIYTNVTDSHDPACWSIAAKCNEHSQTDSIHMTREYASKGRSDDRYTASFVEKHSGEPLKVLEFSLSYRQFKRFLDALTDGLDTLQQS
ncbi:MAG: hypothetical protein QMD85_01510 [Candidatus Aenigmarchaeota archaeon]|nr:hypothetical protein [Candidatus Aenigmarchaeota archaeon]MDI6722216.1 hypothetical protein [Candidatus Aenigmarchaeota archaeon]